MVRTIDFYGTAQDVLSILDTTEKKFEFKYLHLPELFSPEISAYTSARDIPDLLVALMGVKMYRGWHLVPPDCNPEPLGRPHISGKTRYRLCPGPISDAIVFDERGFYEEGNMLLASRFYVLGKDKTNQKMLASMKRLLVRDFRKIRGWHVGEHAFELMQAGVRLNTQVNSPELTDLQLE
jgi:hypothetical protein